MNTNPIEPIVLQFYLDEVSPVYPEHRAMLFAKWGTIFSAIVISPTDLDIGDGQFSVVELDPLGVSRTHVFGKMPDPGYELQKRGDHGIEFRLVKARADKRPMRVRLHILLEYAVSA